MSTNDADIDGSSPPRDGRSLVDPQGLLTDHLACLRCGYDLFGRDQHGRCPECGTAVGRSLLGNWLRLCDPTWLRNVADGLMLFVAAVTVISLIVLDVVVIGLIQRALEQLDIDTDSNLWMVAIVGLYAVLPVVVIWSWVKAVNGEPGLEKTEGPFAPRRLASIALAVIIVLALTTFVIGGLLGEAFRESGAWLAYVMGGAWLVIAVLTPSTFILLLWYMRSLAKRSNAMGLRLALTLFAIVTAVILLFGLLPVLAVENNWFGLRAMAPRRVRELMLLSTGWASFVLVMLLCPLTAWLWRTIRRQARLAEQTWANRKAMNPPDNDAPHPQQ